MVSEKMFKIKEIITKNSWMLNFDFPGFYFSIYKIKFKGNFCVFTHFESCQKMDSIF